jgi:hypothetical protein
MTINQAFPSFVYTHLSQITVAFDETTTIEDVGTLFKVFALGKPVSLLLSQILVYIFYQQKLEAYS